MEPRDIDLEAKILRQNAKCQSSEFTPTPTSKLFTAKRKVYHNPKEKRRKDLKRHLRKIIMKICDIYVCRKAKCAIQ
jgi:hypothetical protein